MNDQIEIYKKKIARDRVVKHHLEHELEKKSLLLYASNTYNQQILDAIGSSTLIVGQDNRIKKINIYSLEKFNWSNSFINKNIFSVIDFFGSNEVAPNKKDVDILNLVGKEFDATLTNGAGENIAVKITISRINLNHFCFEYLYSIKDMSLLNRTQDKILSLQNQLIENAYRDGVAENAVSTLHNIGNVLSAVMGRVSNHASLKKLNLSNLIIEKLIENFEKLHSDEDFYRYICHEKHGQKLLLLFKGLLKNYHDVASDTYECATFVRERVMDIGTIISTQQKYANFRDKKRDNIPLYEIVSNCLYMYKDKLHARGVITSINIDPNITVYMDKIGFAQTISNSILNSIEAIELRLTQDKHYNSPTFIVTIGSMDSKHVILVLSDNGVGLTAKDKANIFNFGYSSKKRGSGFGLHNCINIMKYNNGTIKLESDGPNQGARMILTCPTG